MAYQNIPVSNGYQVVQQIANFASSIGWTVHRNEDRPADPTFRLVTLSAGGIYVTIIGDSLTILMNGHRGIDMSADWDRQPDQYAYYDGDGTYDNDPEERYSRALTRLRVNPLTSVHLFGAMTPTPYLYAAIELEPGFYRHIAIGHFETFGNLTGGTFWDTSGPSNDDYASFQDYHRVPFLHNQQASTGQAFGGFDCQAADGSPHFYSFAQNSRQPWPAGGCWGSEVNSFLVANPIQFNGRTALLTPLVWATANGYRPVGTPPAFKYLVLDYFETGDEFTIGSETWKVFPWARRKTETRDSLYSDAPSDEATGMYGIAYKKA
ncbi:hypothetical protein [Marinobacter nauticus]|uniref:hypothetical protein n=1 Tax=Marinobacter nauticus TaxID=2743 RepID=UPI0037363CB1